MSVPLLLTGLLSYAYAQFSDNAYVVRTVHVFPSNVEAEGWNNIDTLTFQNLDEYALLQEFNSINSATLDDNLIEEVGDVGQAEDNTHSSSYDVTPGADEGLIESQDNSATEFGITNVPDVAESLVNPGLLEAQTTTTEPIVNPEVEFINEEINSVSDEENSTTTVMRRVESLFALAVSTVTSMFGAGTSTEVSLETTNAVEIEQPVAESADDESVSELTEEEVTISVAADEEVVLEEEFLTTEGTVETEEMSNVIGDSELPAELLEEITPLEPVTTTEDIVTHEDVILCTENCTPHIITLSDFGYQLDEGIEVSGAQLRLSFAAKKKESREHIPLFTVQYSTDSGQTWSQAGSIVIEDEISNSINGGYYLYALPEVVNQISFDSLMVQLIYADDPAVVKDLFVESVWLELFTLEAPDAEPPANFLELLNDDGYDEVQPFGDELTLPEGEVVDIKFTDDTNGETLIIKSNETSYQGLSEISTYFSVTNTTDEADEFTLQTYFPDDVGEVTSLEVFNQNKPREAVIPEYRPYVYNCEAGWEYAGDYVPSSLEELSRQLVDPNTDGATSTEETTSPATEVDFDVPTSSIDLPPVDSDITNTTTTVLNALPNITQLLQFSATETVSENQAAVVIDESGIDAQDSEDSSDAIVPSDGEVEALVPVYSCRNTNIVRKCDELDGGNTACLMNQVKVADHEVTRYAPGWDSVEIEEGTMPQPGFFRRVVEFIGFGPDRKNVPEEFEVRTHTPNTYTIEPGETRYFKMDISFPPFTEGEYWIEAVGKSEYGLLDPFWVSDWTYRMPITIDNTSGTTNLTEYQVFFEIDSALSDFWTNVQSDGSDIRFAQQVSVGNFSNAGTAKNNWFDTNFGGRVPLTIPPLTVAEDQINFPVYVDLSLFDAGFWSSVKADGGDIRVTKSDGTEVPIDMVEINTTAETGELHFLADVIVANAANTFYIYYDNAGASGYAASNPLGREAVWAGYEAVYHFNDDPTTIGNTVTDVTGKGRDVTVITQAMSTTTGQMGTALDLTGVTTGWLADTSWTFDGGDPLITTGLYYQTTASNEAIWQWGTGAQPNSIEFRPWYTGTYTNGTGLHYFGATAGATYSFARASTTWHSFGTIGTTSAADNNYVYDNGVLVETVPQTIGNPTNTDATGFQIGRQGAGGSWNGLLDELRIATSTRTHERVKWESTNLSDPTHFYTVNDSQVPDNAANLTWYSTSWEKRLKFSIPQAKISANVTDFPVYLDLSMLGDDFFASVKSTGADIRITTGDGVTERPIELVSINTGTKTGELYFKADLFAQAPNDFYVYFANEDAIAYTHTDTFGSDNVWTNNYKAVYHLEGDAAGIANFDVYKDSTANQYHGDDYNTSNDKSGKFGKGQEFGDNQDDYLSLPREVLNGVANLTTSWWHTTTNGGAQAIVSGAKDNTTAGANEYIAWFNNTTNFEVYYQNAAEGFGLADTIASHNTGVWNFFAVTGEDSIDEVNFYINGVGDTENPDPQPITPLSIANGGLIVGQEQDSLGGGFQSNQNFEGQLDELRFSNVVRSANWLATEYANMNNVEAFIATSTAEELNITDFVELDFWVQHFDATADEADIWVQVANLPAGEETVIYMYYGNAGATTASDEMATFSYSTSTEIFHVVDNSSANQVSVVSLVDNNEVTLSGGSPVQLNRGERTTFNTFTGASSISVLGPISGTVTNNAATDGSETIVPIAFATTTQVIPTNRGTEVYYVKSPFATSSVSTYIAAAGAPTQTLAVNKNAVTTFSATNPGASQAVILQSNNPILVTQRASGGTAQDGVVAYPPTIRDLFGINSNNVYATALAASSNPTAYCSGGASAVQSGITRGDSQAVTTCPSGTQFTGNAVRFTGQANPIAALQQADSDGNESTIFWPQMEFSTRYAMSNQSEFVAIVCSPRFGNTDIEVLDTTGSVVSSGTCSASGNLPGVLRLGNPSTVASQGSAYYAAGYQVVSTNGVPFYAVYEDTSVTSGEDEKNIVGTVQARKFDGVITRTTSFGAEEPATTITYNDDYEQLSFAWYENTTSQTPTVRWPISASEKADEGIAISGSGAVDDGDVLRLRLNMAVSSATSTAQSSAFSLQYSPATAAGQCSSAIAWQELGETGSTTAVFRGYDNAAIGDGTTLSSTTLALSTVKATYEERNYSDFIPNEIGIGQVGEWDWVIEAVNVDVNTTYCFRMVRATGEEMTTYTKYPELITVGPPNAPTNLVYFDNEHTTDLIPVLEFTTIDLAGDDIHYEVQIDDDSTFSSVDINKNSTTHFLNFENVTTPSDKAPFNSGNLIRFTSPTGLASSTTYWWRVRASDPLGSATTSDWSIPTSFTTNQNLETSEWFQTTGEQFGTNSLTSLTTAAGQVNLTGALGIMVGTPVDFNNAVVGNAWAEADWNDTETSGVILVQVEYKNGGSWQLVPNSLIPGNSVGTTTAPINLRELDTDTYNELRLVATFNGTTLSLQDWTIRWGLRVETPVLGDLFDNQKTVDTLPVFDFISSDPQGDDLEYEISFSTDKTFQTGVTTYNSGSDSGFVNQSDGGDAAPFTSGDTVNYTTEGGSPFTNGVTYWWRARAKDPNGENSWSPWANPDSFTVDTAVTVSTWFQTTKGQFEEGVFSGAIASTSGSVIVSDQVGEYGKTTVTNGTWTTIPLLSTYNDPVVVASVRYTPLGDAPRSARVRNKTATSFELLVSNSAGISAGTTVVDYLVMELGEWTLEDGATGKRVIAGTYENVDDVVASTYAASGYGKDVAFSPVFSSAPAVIGTISSDNDSTWAVVGLNDGNVRNNTPTASGMGIYLGRGVQTAIHDPEDVDYIVMQTGHGTNNTSEFDADVTAAVHDEAPVTAEAFTSPFSSAPNVVLVQQGAELGGQGGFAGLYAATPPTTNNYYPFIDEDVTADRAHATEQILTMAFENVSGVLKRYSGAGLTGTIAGENIIFSDGVGPKYDNFTWNDSTPGASDILYQIQYEATPGAYALIPNAIIPGNSTGSTVSPIDLTNVDINTYPVIRPFATLSCSGGNCPQINDWQLEWSEGVNMSGTLKEYDRLTNVATGTIRAAVNSSLSPSTGTVVAGVWTLNNITAFAGDIVTVWVDGATDSEEAVAAFVYDGAGDITGVELFEQHLSISADEETTVTNTLLGLYDNLASGDEDIFYNVDAFNNLVVCSVGVCADANIYVGSGNKYVPSAAAVASISTHDLVNNGTIELDANTYYVSGSWYNYATSSTDTSTINFTASVGAESIISPESTLLFHTLIFGSGAGGVTFTLPKGLDLSGSLTVASGTLDRSNFAISLAGNLTTGTAGFWLGTGTTTFDGAGAKTWRDDNTITQKIGDVLIDGASTFVTAQTDVGAYDITIGTNDRLTGSVGNTIYVGGDWTNTGTYVAQSGTVEIVNDNRTYPPVIPGSQDWYSDVNFDSRMMININPNEVNGNLTNFPVYVNLANLGGTFWSQVAADGRDIRITRGNGQTEIPYDLVKINTTAKTGELHFLANSVDSATTTTFFIYFNNPGASAYAPTDTYGSEAVWTGYRAVYHFKDNPTAVSNTIYDSTANNRDLLVEVAALATSTGKLGWGLNLIGSNGILRNAAFTWTAGDPLITSGWYKMPAASNESLWQWGTGASPHNIEFRPWYQTTNGLHYFGVTTGATYSQSPRDTVNWLHFVTIGATSTSQDNLVYQNAIEIERVTQTIANPYNNGATGLQIGRNGTTNSIDAQIDEFRITTTSRNTDWIEAEYSNQSNPTVFYATTSVQSYTPDLVIDQATHKVKAGGSSFYNLVLNDATTTPAFTEPSVALTNDFTIATGTVALPTGVLTIGGSFVNNGYFMHNNAQITFNGAGAKVITLNGTGFYNALYNVTFSGTGSWTFTDTNATTSNDIIINSGTVMLPTGIMNIGGLLDVNGGGFNANAGTVLFTSAANENISTTGSSFYNVIFGADNSSSGWFDAAWGQRMVIAVASTSVAGSVSSFPVYVNLNMLGSAFWNGVATDGRDIRVTTTNGKTEIPVEIVEINPTLKTGELHFLAPSLSATSDTTFYLYFDNSLATMPAVDSIYGSRAVWNAYEAVYHFNTDPVLGTTDVSGKGKDLIPLVGTPTTIAGAIGTAIDMTSGNVMVGDADWTWTAGKDLVSSGLYYQSAVDTGALWEFGTVCGANDGTCLAFLPWYTGTTGYHRFGVTTGDTYTFTRNSTIWHHFTTNGRAVAGETNQVFEDGILQGSVLQTAPAQNPSNTGLQLGRYTGGTYMDIKIDELRFATTSRSQEWVTTEFRNLTSVSTFYSTSTQTYLQVVPSFTLNESVTDVDGDVTIYYANLVAPTSNFTIGGSALNVGGSYNPNNATTTFNSNDIGETLDFGDGAFYNLSFNGAGGGWIIATTTVNNNASLVTGADFTLATNTTLYVAGKFSNSFNSAATTWTDSTLVLTGGDYTVTGKLGTGDDYSRVEISNDSDLILWNSTIDSFSVESDSSLYMPNYSGVLGNLRIYGSYVRTSGTEYWSYATDFDGTSLTGGSERVVNVEIGRGSSLYFGTSTTLQAIGISGATTTVSALSGIYSLNVNAGTLNTQYSSFQNTGPKGLYLTNGTTVTNLTSVEFAVAGGRSGITVDTSTVNAQPSSEFTNIIFSTSTANGIYETAWTEQVLLTIQSSVVNENHTDYPVYVNLSLLGNDFWSGVQTDGRDIRVTTDDGTELPIDLVEINVTTKTGELYFLAPDILANTNKVFYIHYNNPAAVAYANNDEYGANSVWVNYEAVYHFNENPTVSITDMTGNERNLIPTIGSMATTSGLLGTALDTTGGNTRLENLGWTWTPGDNLISSGLYFMSNFDAGALWQFGAGSGTDNGTYLSFMPWYNSATRGYHYFGVTTGGDYDFARNNAIWHHFTTIGRAATGQNNDFYEDNVLRDSVVQLGSSQNPSNIGLRIGAYQTTNYLDVNIDELRFASTTPSVNWINTEYINFTNPQSFYATSSAETVSYNVTTEGVPSAFWLFSNGSGSLYGEAFDNDDGDPGSIQWGDSNFAVTISGVVYTDDGVTPATAPLCNGSTEVVTVVLDGVTTFTAPCDPLDGSYEVTGISYVGEPQITTYINSDAVAAQTNVAIYDEITGNGVTGGNVMTVSRPAVVDNSVLVLIAGKDDDINFGTPAGWTAVSIIGDITGDDLATGIWYRVVANAGIEAATYDFPILDNAEGYSYWMGTLLNVNTVSPVDVVSAWTKIQDLTNPAAASLTTVTNGALVLSAWYSYLDSEVIPPPYNWTTRASNIRDSADNNLTVSSRLMSTAGVTGAASTDGVIFTRETHTGQFAFRPAGSPTATGTIVAAAVTKTPIGSDGSPYDTVSLRDQRTGFGTVNAGANFTVDRPAIQNGDVLVAIAGKEDDFSITAPAGWVLGADRLEAVGNQMYTALWYKVVTDAGGEPATYSFTNNDTTVEEYSYWVGSFSGVDTANIFEVSPAWSNLQNTSSPAAPTLTTVRNGAYVLSTWYVIDDGAMDMPSSPWVTHAQDLVTANRLLAVSGRLMSTAGATGAATLTGGSIDDVNVGQFALRPAPISVANSISDMHLYQNRVIVRHADATPLSIADMVIFDNDNDSDLPFTATLGSPNNLTVLPGSGLTIWNNRTFDAGGSITLSGVGSYGADGSLLINQSGTLITSGTDPLTIGGSMYLQSGATFTGASSPVTFTATNAGQSIGSAASSTITFGNISFTGVGGGWVVQTPIVSLTNMLVSTGTVSGVANITLNNGSFSGNGTVDLTGGTTLIKKTNTLGGSRAWTFNNLTLGDGTAGITTPFGTATTSVRGVLTIAAAHFLDANSSVWDLRGTGNAFVENGTFIEDVSTIRYSGATQNIRQTPYYNLVIDTDRGGSVTATAPITGLQVLNNLTIGLLGTSTLNANTNDPTFSVSNNLNIGTLGTLEGSNVKTLTVNGNWNNDGIFNANGGIVALSKISGAATVAAGNSSFARLNVLGSGNYTFTENATSTGAMTINTGSFTLNPGLRLAVGGTFTNSMTDANTTWTGTILNLFSGTAYDINTKTTADTYNTVVTENNTHPRLWNSTTTAVTTNGVSSLYSRNHRNIGGELYIFGDYVNDGYNDHWSYNNDFDGAVLGIARKSSVYIEVGGSVLYPGGSLYIIGTSTASTTIAAQTVGTYQFTVGGDTDVDMNYYSFRDTTSGGLTFTSTPFVNDLSYGDFEVAIAGGSTMTVGGSVITANPALNFTNIRMATTTAINAYNVTATGTSASAWRFVNVLGNLGGEAKDVDPAGDPGYLTWEDSAAVINISGNVYSDEGVTVSAACDGVTNNVRLSVHGLSFASTTCAAGTGAYTFSGINYGVGNTLTVYINDEPENAVSVTQDPVSSITGFDLYENRVIIKSESAAAMTITDMETWDSDDDPDLLFDAETAGTDTLTLPANTKILVWNNKKFSPGGNVTLSGGGTGDAVDGTLELRDGAIFTAVTGQSHSIGGSLLLGATSVFTPGQSAVTFTSAGAGHTIDTNGGGFYNLIFSGAGSWSLIDTAITVSNDLSITAGAVTLPNATTTIGGSLNNTGGSFNANNGVLKFSATDAGNTVRFGGSDVVKVLFSGTGGGWTMSDVNATTTNSFTVTAGTVTLPSGTLTIGHDLKVTSNIIHNSGTLKLTGTGGGNVLQLSSKDLFNLNITAGAGSYTLADASAAILGDLIINSGTFTVGAGTVSIGGIFDASGGTFFNGNGTLLFNSNDTGEYIDTGANNLYNVVIAGVGGGWTIVDHATTTNNFTLSLGNSFTQSSGTTLRVGGVFTNNIGGTATNWNGSTLVLDGAVEYETNTKITTSERYNTLIVGANTDVSTWNVSATSSTVSASGSWYSQDHGGTDGKLNIYGDYHIPVTTEHWSRATDFDGVTLGSPRTVNVAVADTSTVTVDGGILNIVGAVGATSTVANQGSGTYNFIVRNGTFNANYYSFRNLSSNGLQFTRNASVSSLKNGDFEQAANSTTLITLASTTLDANASLVISNTRFANGGFTPGSNVSLDATTTNSWNFTGARGNLWGEAYDIDGTDDCSSIRWDDSQCLLTEQTTYRWRNDDGGEGAVSSTWYDSNWGARKRIRVINSDPATYTDVAVKLDVVYDADMQANFNDLRFTDASGTTTLPFWTERYTNGVDADVWVKIPSLPADGVVEVNMYYKNVSATSTSDISNVFNAYDTFDDNNITEYSGENSKFATAGTYAYGGSYGLDASPNPNAKANDGIGRNDFTVSQGEIIRYMQYVNTAAGSGDEVCTLFGMQSPVTVNQNYAVCLEQFGVDRVSIVRNAQNTDSSGTQLASTTITFATGWYEVEIDWQTDNTIDVVVYDSVGTAVATTTAIDSTYTSGGFGFTFWGQNGGWDSYVSWPRTETKPGAYFGVEQLNGGATWAAPQDTSVGGFAFDETARLRIGIENTGLPITNQSLRLEFAPKLTAPSCEAVSAGSFVQVPVLASCGTSAVCMTTSASTTNDSPTTDHLVTDAGQFIPGKIVANTANQTTNMDISQNEYTELEYAIKLTTNAINDAYCFRVTDGGVSLDSYALLPELTLAFDPVLDPVIINGGFDIALTPGTTTVVLATTTVTDYNGFGDLVSATTTFYKTSVGAACTPDNNNCYIATSSACSFTGCSGNSCVLSCSADFQFHTDSTDADGGQEWFAFMEVSDTAGGIDFGTSPGVEVMTLRALDVQNSIGYGTLDITENTGAFNPTVSLLNFGNEAIDVQIAGTDMTDGVASVIPAAQQRFATTTFDYSACGTCNALSVTGTNIEVDLNKPVIDNPPISDDIYWGIEVPFGTASHPHSGINTFTAIAD